MMTENRIQKTTHSSELLLPELLQLVATDHLHANDVAGSLKLLCREAAACLGKRFQTLTLGHKRTSADEPHRAAHPWPGHAFVTHWGRPEPWRALTLPQRTRLLCLAASSGHTGSLEAALAQCDCNVEPEVLEAAAATGSLPACERLLRQGRCQSATPGIRAAAAAGSIPILHLLLAAEDGDVYGDERWRVDAAAEGACAGGQAGVLAWLKQTHGCRMSDSEAAVKAAEAGQLGMLQTLLPRLPETSLKAAEARRGGASEKGRQEMRLARWRLLDAMALGCPAEVFHFYYGAMWIWPTDKDAADFSSGGDSPSSPSTATANAPQVHVKARNEAMASLLVAAAASGTACWEAKMAFLCTAWGERAAEVMRALTGLPKSGEQMSERPDYCLRLRRLHAAGMPLLANEQWQAIDKGHADALAYLWDERRVQPTERGAVIAPKHVDKAAEELWIDPLRFDNDALLWFIGVAVDSSPTPLDRRPADQGGFWSGAFQHAAGGGASLAVLQALCARGAAVDLEAAAAGGGVATMEWAAAQLTATGQELKAVSRDGLEEVMNSGNWATLAWLRAQGLLRD
ncbi:hypothetical protein HYH02_007545 [Chlamydomonas schloesseri]|uniref:Uncharacterized protein n=1 Tax=Chlamydomonas schloesseri TaxID=2026947 RepID=A0A835WHH9_9CHLO|nr:hypothetical protein HYH02_007545 [Chlamydomonas schloesseri]|eukprot:KAG2447627.1 hypothetical protein HYH02_007545 [Chlamydomonas schloesseri]